MHDNTTTKCDPVAVYVHDNTVEWMRGEVRSVSEVLAGYVLALREIGKDQAASGLQDCIDRLERLL